jgi:hypothetical protein
LARRQVQVKALFGGGNKEVSVSGERAVDGRRRHTHAQAGAARRRGARAHSSHAPSPPPPLHKNTHHHPQGGGGGLPNPFDMGKLMESVKKAQQMVQVETARVQKELDE